MTLRDGGRGFRVALIVGFALGLTLPAVAFLAVPPGTHVPNNRPDLPDRAGATWVSIDPIQCLGNPWEEDWLRMDNGSAGSYPREWVAQRAIIMDYYRRQGIDVIDARQDWWNQPVCEACSCPAGYTLFLHVADEDLDEVVALGFKEVLEPPPVP